MRVRRWGRRSLVPIGLLLLAACVPGARNVRVFELGDAIIVPPGVTARVEANFAYADFGYRPGDSDLLSFLLLPLDQQPRTTEVRTRFALRDASYPPGWSFELTRANAVRGRFGQEFADLEDSDYRFELTFDIAVPEDTPPGTYVVSGLIKARNAEEQQLALAVIVN